MRNRSVTKDAGIGGMTYREEPAHEVGDIQENEVAREARIGRERFIPRERRALTQPQRRSAEPRRQGAAVVDGREKRAAGERRGPSDRKNILYVMTYATNGSIASIEDWLEENCEGEWRVVLQGLGEDLVRKSLRIMFKNKSDRALFHAHCAKGLG